MLAEADKQADATPFVEFMLQALLDAIKQAIATDQVARIIQALAAGELGSAALMKELDLTHKPTFRENYLVPAIEGGWILKDPTGLSPQPDPVLSTHRKKADVGWQGG